MTTKYADDPSTENAKKQLEASKRPEARTTVEYSHTTKGKPTPTQEELNMSMLGAHILEHEDDGSGPDPNVMTRSLEAEKSGTKPQGYQTRQTKTAE